MKFEEHDGILLRMLDKPVPLTPDSKLPCLVRLIQDDSRMGMFNRDTKPSRLSDFYLVARIVSNNIVVDEFMESDYHRFEIIGYLVEEGSAEWALWAMMDENKVINSNGIVPFTLTNDRIVRIDDSVSWDVGHWLRIFDDTTGWEIYKEPIANCDNCKHRCTKSNIDYCQMYEPKPTFKVGDWVEWCGDQYMVESAPPQSGGRYDIRSPYDELGCSVYPENITRKLKPSEIVVRVGCLSGTVRPVSTNGTHIWFYLIDVDDKIIATIRIGCLDKETRKLVEGLLEAQEEKCHS